MNGIGSPVRRGDEGGTKNKLRNMKQTPTKLKQLKPAEFTWKAEFDTNKTQVQGFLAHEVSSIVPEAVSGTKDATKEEDVLDDNGEKLSSPRHDLTQCVKDILDTIQNNLYNQAKDFRDNNTHSVNTYSEFKDIIKNGGFIRCGWDGKQETELKIKEDTKATIRCIPFNENPKGLTCIFSGNEAMHEVIFAKSY